MNNLPKTKRIVNLVCKLFTYIQCITDMHITYILHIKRLLNFFLYILLKIYNKYLLNYYTYKLLYYTRRTRPHGTENICNMLCYLWTKHASTPIINSRTYFSICIQLIYKVPEFLKALVNKQAVQWIGLQDKHWIRKKW